MAQSALVQTRIDVDIKKQAATVLEAIGLTVSDAVRIMLTRAAKEGMLPFALAPDSATYDRWFRSQVQAALNDPRAAVSAKEVNAHFALRRADASRRIHDEPE